MFKYHFCMNNQNAKNFVSIIKIKNEWGASADSYRFL